MRVFATLVLISACLTGYAQWAIPPQMRASITLDNLAQNGLNPTDLLYGIPMEPGKVVGDTYITKVWNISTIMLSESDKIIEGYPARYDIQANALEIKSKSGIKVLNTKSIKSLVWIDSLLIPHYFVNANTFREDGIEQAGLLEVLVDGEILLLNKFYIEVVKPSYNIAMGSGSKDTKLIPRTAAYSAKAGELIRIKTKKDVLKISGEYSDAINKIIADQGLKVNKQYDLIEIFVRLNELKQAAK